MCSTNKTSIHDVFTCLKRKQNKHVHLIENESTFVWKLPFNSISKRNVILSLGIKRNEKQVKYAMRVIGLWSFIFDLRLFQPTSRFGTPIFFKFGTHVPKAIIKYRTKFYINRPRTFTVTTNGNENFKRQRLTFYWTDLPNIQQEPVLASNLSFCQII